MEVSMSSLPEPTTQHVQVCSLRTWLCGEFLSNFNRIGGPRFHCNCVRNFSPGITELCERNYNQDGTQGKKVFFFQFNLKPQTILIQDEMFSLHWISTPAWNFNPPTLPGISAKTEICYVTGPLKENMGKIRGSHPPWLAAIVKKLKS